MFFAPDDSVAGFLLIYPHYGPLVIQKAGDGRVPVSELNYHQHWPLLEKQESIAGLAKTIGIHPNHRGKHLSVALAVQCALWGADRYDCWYGANMAPHVHSRKMMQKMDVTSQRWYALYKKSL
jgi:hypothetical protein